MPASTPTSPIRTTIPASVRHLVVLIAILGAVIALGGLTPAHAASTYTWTGGGSDDSWTNPDNWGGGVPGAIGAFAGATVLSKLSTEAATPVTSGLLLALGLYLVWRFVRLAGRAQVLRAGTHHTAFLTPLGIVGGFIDATGGGGWGPVGTPAILDRVKQRSYQISTSTIASDN